MTALREILATFGVEFDGHGLEKGHDQVEGMIGKLEHLGHTVAVAFGVHEIKEWFENIFEGARAIDLQARTLGMSAESLQTWKYAAHLADVNADEFAARLNMVQQNLYNAANGSKMSAAALTAMGIDYKDASGKVRDLEEILLSVADAVEKASTESEKKNLVGRLFGVRAAAKMIPLFKQGRAGVQKLREEFAELGGGYDEEFLHQTAEVEDAQKRVHYVVQALNIALARKMLPLVEKGAQLVERLVRKLSDWQKQGAITNATMAILTGLMITKLPLIIGFIAKLARMVNLPAIAFAALVLLVDDLITTFQGGESVTRDFIDSMFGDGTTESIVNNIKTISSEVGGLLENFQAKSKTASNTALGVLALIQTIGLVFTATFGAIEAGARVVWRLLGDLSTLLTDIVNVGPKVARLFGFDVGNVLPERQYSTSADYGSDAEKGLGSSADRIDALVKTFQAMGNQTTPGPSSFGEALAAKGEMRPDVAAFLASEGGGGKHVTIQQTNTFNLPPGTTQAQAREVKGAVDEANKSSYRAAQANLEHRVE